jgi:hypothetical protein
MAQNTKHRRNKKNKSVKKQKVRGGTRSFRSRHESQVDTDSSPTRSNARSIVTKSSISLPKEEQTLKDKIQKIQSEQYDENTATLKVIELNQLVENFYNRFYRNTNKKYTWYDNKFQPRSTDIRFMYVSRKYSNTDKFEVILVSRPRN